MQPALISTALMQITTMQLALMPKLDYIKILILLLI